MKLDTSQYLLLDLPVLTVFYIILEPGECKENLNFHKFAFEL